jgi:sulfur-oxidizing protein SoxY
MRTTLSLIAGLVLAMPAAAVAVAETGEQAATVDPLASARWEDMRRAFLADRPMVFDARVKVEAPATAENPLQVPVLVDARTLPGVEEVLVFADFNPIPEALLFRPQSAATFLGFRIKLQQSSPVRAAARTGDGIWHVGGAWVETVGGGCTAPDAGSAAPDWQKTLNQVSARQWTEGPYAGRLRLRISHPMDTGLVAGTPSFHLESIDLKDADGRALMHIEPFEPVSQNPVFTLEDAAGRRLQASGRDNNGNQFSVWIEP